MAKGRGRANKYETHIKPRLDEIEEMARTMTEKQIAQMMGVAMSTWCEYKKQHSELSEKLKKGRETLVKDLISSLVKKAHGFDYSEKKIVKERNEDGDLVVIREEIYHKRSLPDVAALNLLLKNYNKDNWSNDPQILELRKKELELRERQVEANEW